MKKNQRPRVDRFKNSRLQLWVFGGMGSFFCLLSMLMFGVAAVPIVAATVPCMFALALGQTVMTNYAESQNPEYYFPEAEPYRTEPHAPEDK